MLYALLILAATTILGFVLNAISDDFSDWLRSLKNSARNWVGNKREQKRLNYESVANVNARTIEGIMRLGFSKDRLYVPVSYEASGPIPFLTVSDLSVSEIDFGTDGPLVVTDTVKHDFQIDTALVTRLQKQGRKVSNDATLYVLSFDPASHQMTAGVTGFRSIVTNGYKLIDTLGSKRTSSGFIQHLENPVEALSSEIIRPIGLGSVCVSSFWDGEKYLSAMHRRSKTTINAPGASMATPGFTFEPNTTDGFESRFNVIAYNFLKEFLEEFWGEEETVETASRPRSNPDYIFDSPQGTKLLEEMTSGRVHLYLTGIAIDLTQLECTLALLATFDSPDYLKEVRKAPGHVEESPSNFAEMESAGDGVPAISYPPLFGSRMEELLKSNNMKPTALFAVDRAREFLKHQR
jgi:hypothetical protein